MKRPGSRRADVIDKEYKTEQAYKRKTRKKCKETNCNNCKWYPICIDTNKNIKLGGN